MTAPDRGPRDDVPLSARVSLRAEYAPDLSRCAQAILLLLAATATTTPPTTATPPRPHREARNRGAFGQAPR
jgi:hypothetical protein